MMDHTRKKHMPKDSYVECNDCGRTFTSISNLNAHSTIHKEKEDAKYHCGECKIFYFHKSALRRHRKAEHGLDLIECRKLSTSTINSNGSSYYSPCNSADASYLASPPITPKMTNSSCDICSFQSHCIEDYNLHLESAHLLSKDLKCLVNACGTFCGSSKTLHEHQSSCHPFFS
ncbi:hypothetical protein BC833DRAFT_574643 [Globomyces pollinis-pini]|nr:hypothetical protein BC833DRAFT_574643 [Globomyces pollinis-pini]